MYPNFETSTTDDVAEWEQRYCPTDWCPIDTVYVKRHEHQREVWHVTEHVDETGWLVAATGPVCPMCGGNLLTAANVSDGVDGVELGKKAKF